MAEEKLENELSMPEPIYVVGFPKSGNTWLTRLLADILQVPVRGETEIATEINQHLSLSENSRHEIWKIHFLPAYFYEKIDPSPRRIVYIYRDFRDVLVSSFFYFVHRGDDEDAEIMDLSTLLRLLIQSPKTLNRYYQLRKRMLGFVKDFCENGRKKDFGTWQDHIQAWQHVNAKHADMIFASISYEDLLKNSSNALLSLLDELGLPKPDNETLVKSIERQSFDNLKTHLKNLPDDVDIPHGKDFNVKFLRKGVAGDWKRFLSKRMGRVVARYQGEMLSMLEYETDSHWYKDLPSMVFIP